MWSKNWRSASSASVSISSWLVSISENERTAICVVIDAESASTRRLKARALSPISSSESTAIEHASGEQTDRSPLEVMAPRLSPT